MPSRRLISSGSPFETAFGYSRAVIDGDFVFVSGTTGYDYATMTLPEDVAVRKKGLRPLSGEDEIRRSKR